MVTGNMEKMLNAATREEDGPKCTVPAILTQLYVRTAGAGAEGVVSIGNKGTD